MPRARVIAVVVALASAAHVAASARVAHARPAAAPPVLVALAPAPGRDARQAIAIGPAGEIYEPDGKGAWVRTRRITTADRITSAGRAGAHVVAFGDGAIYKLAPSGWSAVRLAQKGKATMSTGRHAVGAVGRQLFALDRLANGEPAKLALAPAAVSAIGSGAKAIVIQTQRGLARVEPTRVVPLKKAPRRIARLIGARWALVDGGVVDLETNRRTKWPAGLAIATAAVTADDRLVAVGTRRGAIELVTVGARALDVVPVTIDAPGAPVGVEVDRGGRAVIAFRDGRLAVRERGTWTTVAVTEALPAARPGPPPAISP